MKTLKLRLKDKHCTLLNQLAKQVNFVWNYVNNLTYEHTRRTGKFLSPYDIQKYTAGASVLGLSINAQTIQVVGAELATRRKQCNKSKLRWRVSDGPKKSLGWIPFSGQSIAYRNGQVRYAGHYFNFWDSYGLSKYNLRSGCFSQDSRGRWYLCVCVTSKESVPPKAKTFTEAVGIDLGLKSFATLSNGIKIESPKLSKEYEERLATAQRTNKKSRVRAIHAKVKNKRQDFHHKLSKSLVDKYLAIFVGDVNVTQLIKSQDKTKAKIAKSALDAGWSAFKTMLKYKCENAGVWFEEVNEAYSTQTCSSCGSRRNSPKGRSGLRIREWTCGGCGITHDRDINAAMNILALGHERLAVGISLL